MVNNKLPVSAPAGARYTVSVIDPVSRAVTAVLPVTPAPHHIYPVPGENEAYVSHFNGCVLDVIDTVTNKVTGTVATAFGPRHLAFSRDGHYAYVADYYDSALSVIDTRSNKTVAQVPTGPYPNYSLASRDGATVFVVNSGANTVTVINGHAPFQVEQTITVGANPFNLALTPDGKTLITANAGDNTVTLIDTHSLAVTATISIRKAGQRPALTATGKLSQKLNVRVAPDGRYAWVGDQLGADWAVIDLSSRTLADTFPAGAGADILFPITRGPMAGLGLGTARYAAELSTLDPNRPAILGATRTATAVTSGSGGAAVFTGSSGPLGTGPHVAALNQGQTTAYVADRPGGSVSVLDLASGRPIVTATILVGMYPDGISYLWFDHGIATAAGD